MRKMIVMAAMLMASLPLIQAQDTAKVRIRPYGFVRNYLNVDSRRMLTVCGGEYLMIPYDEETPSSLYDSHLWYKCKSVLLVWYRRDRNIDPYDQRIEYVALFTPPDRDMMVIERDYALIAWLVREGRADELSESLTSYLGACTRNTPGACHLSRRSCKACCIEVLGPGRNSGTIDIPFRIRHRQTILISNVHIVSSAGCLYGNHSVGPYRKSRNICE